MQTKSEQVNFRARPAEVEQWREAASADGRSLNTWLEQAAREKLAHQKRIRYPSPLAVKTA